MRITALVNQLRTLGDNVEEVRVVQKVLRVVPSRYAQIAVAIETLLDLSTISVEELIGRLRTAEERCGNAPTPASGGQLLMTEQQWYARHREREQGQHSGSGSAGGNGNGGGGNRRRGKPQNQRRDNNNQGNGGGTSREGAGNGGRDMSKVKCYNCKRTGTSLAAAPSHGANARSR